jgi:hypothetical protein
MKKIGFLTTLLIAVIGLQAQFSLDAEIRPRSELSHGFAKLADLNQDASFFTTQRTRLNFIYSKDKLKTKLSLQDVRLWGSQPQLVGNEDFATSVHEAWAEAFLTECLSLKLGRQELVYDNSRIFGNVGWAQQARSHDLFLLKYKKQFEFHIGAAFNQDADRTTNFYFGPDAYKMMQFFWLRRASENLKISILVLNNGIPFNTTDTLGNVQQEVKYSQTLGTYFVYSKDNLKIDGNIYYQVGKSPTDKDIEAYNFMLNASYKFDKLNLGIGYELLSGNSYKDTLNKTYAFTPFYGTNHKFNGHMDYFYVGNHMNSVGLNNFQFNAKYELEKSDISLAIHYFTAAAEISSNSDLYLGTEFDLAYGYKMTDFSHMKLGFSYMLGSESMELLKGGDKDANSYWAYLMFTFKPKFI